MSKHSSRRDKALVIGYGLGAVALTVAGVAITTVTNKTTQWILTIAYATVAVMYMYAVTKPIARLVDEDEYDDE